ncbi:MAG: EAL domain-containing protein [Roseitalea sp.]|jgi:diguanylate cyclase (GGDEF)-like protein|nr:EAL domain-containing protein [Roseitalea sp.]MBO6721079.1 EAL domain-containing protein [Roseitalea sp.]MBO6742849.1 EAL domain-containing protein [Roseitalea sp.]
MWDTDATHQFTTLDSLDKPPTTNDQPLTSRSRQQQSAAREIRDWLGRSHFELLQKREPFDGWRASFDSPDGRLRNFESSAAPRWDRSGRFLGFRGITRELSSDLQKNPGFDDREAWLQKILLEQIERVSSVGAWRWTLENGRLCWSDEVYRIYEVPIGTPMTLARAAKAYDRAALDMLKEAIERAAAENRPFDLTTEFTTERGNHRWVRAIGVPQEIDGEVTGIFGTLQDMTEQSAQHQHIHDMAMIDTLTGIANREAFDRYLDMLTRTESRQRRSAVLCIVDLDNFKDVNDQYGHEVGDGVLRAFARRLSRAMDDQCFLARLDSDEFGVVVNEVEDLSETIGTLVKQLKEVGKGIEVSDIRVDVSATVGYTELSGCGLEAGSLLRRADLALLEAKRDLKISAHGFTARMEENFNRRVAVRKEFQRALNEAQIVPHYQPVISLSTGQITSMEALARWHHPKRGVLSPSVFMEVFNDHETCVKLTNVMLEHVSSDMRTWLSRNVHFGRIALNVTAADLKQPGFALRLIGLLEQHNLRARHLTLEITETAIFGGSDAIVDQLQLLREAGITIALDDFGTGYSCLTHLKSVPFDILKIDKSFVNDMMRSDADRAIVRSLIELGNDIGYTTVAEGIEVKTEASYLREVGCTSGQGYFFHKPMPKSEIEVVLGGPVNIAT